MKEIIKTDKAPAAIGPYSQGVIVGNMVFLSGQLALVDGSIISGGAKEEAKGIMENIKAVLAQAGLGMESIVKATIFLKDMGDFAAVNEVYSSYFQSNFPARECVQAAALPKNATVEISVIAYKG